jgi:hypothetical protein
MQLVQLIQYAKNGALSMSVSNKVMNLSITPKDLQAYESLGFDTSLFNEDDDCFSLDMKIPIPMVQYRDSYTWVKYCPHYMELDFYGKGQVKNNLHGSFCSIMINFPQTDISGTPIYSMNPNIMGQLQQFLVQCLDPELDKQLLSSMWDQHLENNETKENIRNKLSKIATTATAIPFLIFTNMMCQHFGKLKFLESTLELLQQFKLQMISTSGEFTIFPVDCSKFSLKCTRCGKCVTYPESIGWTLSMAPYAILSHLDIMLLDENENDASNQLETLSWEIAAMLSRVVQWGVRHIVARGAQNIKSIHIVLYSSINILAHQMCHICFYLLNQKNK